MENDDNLLINLKIKELARMLKHVRLGNEHLATYLTTREFNQLLRIGRVRASERSNIDSDLQEEAGNILLVLNTILTSCMGAWLGFSGFSGLHLRSYITLIIIGLALTIGGLIGRLSYKLTTKQASNALVTHRLFNVELEIVKTIIAKRSTTIEALEKRILQTMNKLGAASITNFTDGSADLKQILAHESNGLRLKEHFNQHFKQFDEASLNYFYRNLVFTIFKSVDKLFSQLRESYYPKKKLVTGIIDNSYSETDLLLNTSLTNASYIRVLTKTDLPSRKLVPRAAHWIRKNILGIAVGLLPTILGGFASMFVFLDGIPDILKAFHLYQPAFETYNLSIKILCLSCAILLTTYMGYSNIHTNYKAFRRSKQLELAERKIAEAEERMMHLEGVQHLLLKLKNYLSQLDIISKSIEATEQLA
jgi:hypothetical protein